ncbi:hypothetical protein SAMN05444266_111124 [Chitinophaga jiangningensis]|uniref:Pyridoxamine 5'-phosphate oxidase n=1 Tax=Chitinophaga jiangningensis TaxID=1419482 RepID=A0A1M7LU54_9BACT|nr:pyridoxamine 5'-phosphate oxidase family protein [Chitinophaga jiangningensis]SHM81270.1 hypothetical protein SAMN05444266_111124 [Chitinophaga jiangningensis]
MIGTLTPEEIDEILTKHATGRIGCTDGLQPYIVPVSYAYNGTYLVGHSRPGLKIDIMRKNPNVCFQTDEIDDLENWRSVLVRGEFEEVSEQREKYYLMKFLVGHLQQYHAAETGGFKELLMNSERHPPAVRPIVFKIIVTEKTGRFGHGWASY